MGSRSRSPRRSRSPTRRRNRTPSSSRSPPARHTKSKNQRRDKDDHRDRGRDKERERERERDRDRDRNRDRDRSRDRSRSRDRDDDDDKDARQRKKAEKEAKLEEKRRQAEEKKHLKETETPEQKRERRLAKKDAKEKARRAKLGWDEDTMGYSNTNNPFGDANLLEQFTWHKKIESAEATGITKEQLDEIDRHRRRENRIELSKVKKRREEREKEKKEMEDAEEWMARERERDQFGEWIKQEEDFHLMQAKMRSEMRMKENRAKPIDILAHYIHSTQDGSDMPMHEPYVILNTLPVEDLEDLREDILVYQQLEKNVNSDFWNDMLIICDRELSERKRLAVAQNPAANAAELRALDTGINNSVRTNILKIFKGKTEKQLLRLKADITQRIGAGGTIDLTYWEAVLAEMDSQMARARIRDRHEELLRQHLNSLRGGASAASAAMMGVGSASAAGAEGAAAASVGARAGAADGGSDSEGDSGMQDEGPSAAPAVPAAPALEVPDGSWSPVPVRKQDYVAEPNEVVLTLEEDRARIYEARQAIKPSRAVVERSDAMVVEEERKGLAADEEAFNIDFQVSGETYSWAEKYRPRKPRFYNRVLTGFDWNPYNRTHYDHDNPPPKTIQGYKFNIFYPDLINRDKAPTFNIHYLKNEPGFCVIRFNAGPPYEDIAFKIVDGPWLYGRKAGYRCQFDNNNVFQLWFRFKRDRYRR